MEIGRTDGVHGPGRIQGPRIDRIQPPAQPARSADAVRLSESAHLVGQTMSLPDIRTERVTEFRRLIEAGIYQSDDRLIGAFEKFRQELRGL